MPKEPTNRERLYRFTCPICGRVEVLEGDRQEATQQLKELGWKLSSQISEKEHEWHLVCPRHYEGPRSRTILNDAEQDPQPVNLPLVEE